MSLIFVTTKVVLLVQRLRQRQPLNQPQQQRQPLVRQRPTLLLDALLSPYAFF